MNSPLPQAEVRALLGGGCFLRRADRDTALFVTDAPRRLTEAALADRERFLAAAGFRCGATPSGLWQIDPDESRWVSILRPYADVPPAGFPANEALWEVYALARLLRAHPSPWENQPREAIRGVLKRLDRTAELLRYAPALLTECAVRLRHRQALPCAASPLLDAWLAQHDRGASK